MCSNFMLYNSIILRLNKQFQLWSVSRAHTDHMKKKPGIPRGIPDPIEKL